MYIDPDQKPLLNKSERLGLNCHAEYFRNFLMKEECESLYKNLITKYQIASLNQKYAAGKIFHLDFGKIMFVDKQLHETKKFPEQLWGKSVIWSEQLWNIKQRVEELAGIPFHVCVCVYYPDGNSGVGYHSDFPAYGDTTVIASVSIGEVRDFLLREKSTLRETRITLEEGSLLIMGEHCQDRYEHSLPVDPTYLNGRINLTFRQYGFDN